ncbi:hypothetical protein AQS8620_01030 [Aquimixticola soesokkakensis]|uniref:DUF2842 domain-containing protein n=1 Tax=Aquimixticola soesokkakensis TaxID=1519096 RepID=A0A1Y5S3T7_9RHOB|nr:DUF2842 domain-containing protein [Aquimixticola soesokkakensis]SLN31572.1 hypothetical protein AQS8620_01030 [Aquimixticola soesokkakensis]
MALSYKGRRRLAMLALVVGLPAYIVACVTVVNLAERALGRPSILLEFVIYAALGVAWAFPLKSVFQGVGGADPDAEPPVYLDDAVREADKLREKYEIKK